MNYYLEDGSILEPPHCVDVYKREERERERCTLTIDRPTTRTIHLGFQFWIDDPSDRSIQKTLAQKILPIAIVSWGAYPSSHYFKLFYYSFCLNNYRASLRRNRRPALIASVTRSITAAVFLVESLSLLNSGQKGEKMRDVEWFYTISAQFHSLRRNGLIDSNCVCAHVVWFSFLSAEAIELTSARRHHFLRIEFPLTC